MIIHVNEIYLILNYLIAAIVSIVIALGLGLPLLPKKPKRFSFDKTAVFPTPIFAIGFLAICFSVNFFWIYNGVALAVFWGVVSGLFVKYAFDYVFPKPSEENGDNSDDLNNKSKNDDTNAKKVLADE